VPADTRGRSTLALADREIMALRSNSTLVQATANIDNARGRAVQSGLYPNPIVGYNGEQSAWSTKTWA
jgi:cobalt-zinc-cadmium efflux system outer membrane protein